MEEYPFYFRALLRILQQIDTVESPFLFVAVKTATRTIRDYSDFPDGLISSVLAKIESD